MVYYYSHSIPWDAIYSGLNINVSRGLRQNGRINYSCAYQGEDVEEISPLRLSDHTVEKTCVTGASSQVDNFEIKTSYRINARAFPFFFPLITYVKALCRILILDYTN